MIVAESTATMSADARVGGSIRYGRACSARSVRGTGKKCTTLSVQPAVLGTRLIGAIGQKDMQRLLRANVRTELVGSDRSSKP